MAKTWTLHSWYGKISSWYMFVYVQEVKVWGWPLWSFKATSWLSGRATTNDCAGTFATHKPLGTCGTCMLQSLNWNLCLLPIGNHITSKIVRLRTYCSTLIYRVLLYGTGAHLKISLCSLCSPPGLPVLLMAALRAFLPLAVCLLLGHQTSAKNDAPCQRSKWNNGYATFIKRHIRAGTPTSLDNNEWSKYIRNNGGCDRPTQSFLHPSDLEKVKDVCTSQGGKTYKENLCISRQPFKFVTVRSEQGTCGIRSIREETKHLILACEVLENQCLPVHFEGNPQDNKPDNNARGCQDPQRAQASSFKMTWSWLLSVLLVIVYAQ